MAPSSSVISAGPRRHELELIHPEDGLGHLGVDEVVGRHRRPSIALGQERDPAVVPRVEVVEARLRDVRAQLAERVLDVDPNGRRSGIGLRRGRSGHIAAADDESGP